MADEKLSKELLLKIWDAAAGSYKTVARSTGYSREVNKETVDVTSFDSTGSWKEFLVDLKDWSVSADGIVVRTTEAGKLNYEELLQSLIGTDTTLILQFIDPDVYTDSTDGALYAHEIGNVFLTSLPVTGSLGDKQTYSATLQGSGVLTLVSAKYDSEAEAYAAKASWAENDVILVVDNIAIGTSGYYSRTAAAGTNFADTWTTYVI